MAAARKNCSAYASHCSEPRRLVYHCVINPYVNQTLEVCAYAQNIVSGIVLFKNYFYLINCKVLSSFASLLQLERNKNSKKKFIYNSSIKGSDVRLIL